MAEYAVQKRIALMPVSPAEEDERDLELFAVLSREKDVKSAAYQEAWRDLVERYKNYVYCIALHVAQKPETAEEIVQDVFLALFRAWRKGWEARRNLRGWLSAVTVRKAMRVLRKRRRVALKTAKLRVETVAQETADETQWAEARNTALALVKELPETLRLPVVMYFVGGMKQDDIARELRCRQSTISERLQQALTQLRAGMRKSGFASLPAALPALLSQAFATDTAPAYLTVKLTSIIERTSVKNVKAPLFTKKATVAWRFAGLFSIALAMTAYFWSRSSMPTDQAAKHGDSLVAASDQTPPDKNKFYYRWTFENGLPAELSVKEGSWTLRKIPSMSSKTLLASSTEQMAWLCPSVQLPERPFLLTLKTFRLKDQERAEVEGGIVFSSRSITPRLQYNDDAVKQAVWKNEKSYWRSDDIEPDVFELYYGIDKDWTITLHNRQLFCISEERSAGFSYADRHIFIFARSLGVEEVELREIEMEEIPEFIRKPKKLLAKEGIQMEALKRSEAEQKIVKAVRNRR